MGSKSTYWITAKGGMVYQHRGDGKPTGKGFLSREELIAAIKDPENDVVDLRRHRGAEIPQE